MPVVYDPGIPSEHFDAIIIDECHRSIDSLWRQVLLQTDNNAALTSLSGLFGITSMGRNLSIGGNAALTSLAD